MHDQNASNPAEFPSKASPGDLLALDAAEMAAAIRSGALSPVTLVERALERAEAVQAQLNAFVVIRRDEALEAARVAEREAAEAGKSGAALGPLHGVPVALKDMTPTKGDIWTDGSRLFDGRVADHDATIADALLGAGAILLAKTTTPEFAWSSRTDSPLWGVTRNPYDPSRTSGGSSGGAGVAVATGCVPLAEGSDMGGSIRIPASCCGVIGFKPSLGRIPYTGLPNAFDPLSHWGPLARTCRDVALFLDVTQGGVSHDGAPRNGDPGYDLAPVERFAARVGSLDPARLRVGVSVDLGCYEVDAAIADNLRATADALARMGAEVEVVDVVFPAEHAALWDREWAVWQAFYYGEAAAGREDALDPEMRALIEEGRQIRAVDYRQGEIMRTTMWRSLAPILRRCDVLLCPTLARDVPSADGLLPPAYVTANGRLREVTMTGAFNLLARLPALSVPSGVSASGLPTGVQVIGRPGDDLTALQVGALIESAIGAPIAPVGSFGQ
ncbi:amidase [Acetobacter nitrogenifigens DSM 23921 = NBRC 105050]|uniref:Amidase n=3 Tax=Acetobacter nitrogenifigens TaxID=285268 RepID=A0A511XBC8_9PROT|nr:amidase [Acetobacter nitrogenifigens DSM 23921 = NBRC 105050]